DEPTYPSEVVWEEWDDVAAAAQGQKADYAISGKHIGRGGQATVARAMHRATGTPVAFKRLLPGSLADDEALARMRREVKVGTTFDDPHLMRILDSDPGGTWFVMPLATSGLQQHRTSLASDERSLRELVNHICAGLMPAHAAGWTHRDIKPDNILRF